MANTYLAMLETQVTLDGLLTGQIQGKGREGTSRVGRVTSDVVRGARDAKH